MRVKIAVSACICALGLIVAVIGYQQMASIGGPARNLAPGTVDAGMTIVGVGACLALLGAVLTIFAAVRSRA